MSCGKAEGPIAGKEMHQTHAAGTRKVRRGGVWAGPEPTMNAMMTTAPLPMDTPARLTELEIKLSFTEDLVDELNRTVAHQQEQITLLQDELRALFQQVQQLAPGEKTDLREDIPPHY